LRERRGDIVPLAERAIDRHADLATARPRLSADAAAALVAHDWPGNVRELENLVQRALILAQDDRLTAADLVFEESGTPAALPPEGLQDDLKQREYRMIQDALRAAGGNRGAVAAKLGISPRTLRYKLARMREAGINL